MLTEVVALEEQGSGLRAFALAPGVVDTDMQDLIRSTPDTDFPSAPRFRQLHADGRLSSPDRAARYVLDELLVAGDRLAADRPGVRLRVPDR
jgi:NAD(P)-dependent dehydrogenase (short-subunit alcohol dehydrogenase family)